ncbi:hypothetical protein B0O80DRAFT_469844 [Mortierella sp. GBAus27b]|nr:hypothetical protein B0O80DRAFT_469844 [Mortierella sp. GBAus27b]
MQDRTIQVLHTYNPIVGAVARILPLVASGVGHSKIREPPLRRIMDQEPNVKCMDVRTTELGYQC